MSLKWKEQQLKLYALRYKFNKISGKNNLQMLLILLIYYLDI